jgi:DNA/RNA endonuclease G (NUC1)
MPAPAGKDPEKDRGAFLIARPQYGLSYNAKTRTPNWVPWELKKDDIGNAKRLSRRGYQGPHPYSALSNVGEPPDVCQILD